MGIKWHEAYCVGDAQIDHQHQQLFRIANEFLLAVTKDEQLRYAQALFDYAGSHFAYEEGLMRKYNYQGYSAHVASHKKLILRLAKLTERLTSDALDRVDLEYFVKRWALFHIPREDAKLAQYLAYGDTQKASVLPK